MPPRHFRASLVCSPSHQYNKCRCTLLRVASYKQAQVKYQINNFCVFLQLPAFLKNELHHRRFLMVLPIPKEQIIPKLKTTDWFQIYQQRSEKNLFLFLRIFPVKGKINKISIPLLGPKSTSLKCKTILRKCCNPDSSSFLLSLSINFVITSCAGLHEKSVSSVAAHFQCHIFALKPLETLHFHTIPVLGLSPLLIYDLLGL